MKRFRVILAIGAVLVWAAVFPLGCSVSDGTRVDTNNVVRVYTDKDVVSYGDTIMISIEYIGDEPIEAYPLLSIVDSAGQTVYMTAFIPRVPPPTVEPGQKATLPWTPVRYPADDGNWLEGELLPGDYYAVGGLRTEDGTRYSSRTKFTVVEESGL